MKRFSKSSLDKLRKGEIIQFMRNVVKVFQVYDIIALNLEGHITDLVEGVNDLSAIHKRKADTEMTDGLKQLDKNRMSKLRGVKLFLDSQFRMLDGDQKEAARVLLNNYDDHITNSQNSSAQEKTANIIAMLDDWRQKANLSAAIETLAMGPFIEKLVEVNEVYDEKYIERSLTDKLLKMTEEKRSRIMDSFLELYRHTDAYSVISDQKDTYKAILAEVNLLVKNYKNPVNIRYALKGKAKDVEIPIEENTDANRFSM